MAMTNLAQQTCREQTACLRSVSPGFISALDKWRLLCRIADDAITGTVDQGVAYFEWLENGSAKPVYLSHLARIDRSVARLELRPVPPGRSRLTVALRNRSEALSWLLAEGRTLSMGHRTDNDWGRAFYDKAFATTSNDTEPAVNVSVVVECDFHDWEDWAQMPAVRRLVVHRNGFIDGNPPPADFARSP